MEQTNQYRRLQVRPATETQVVLPPSKLHAIGNKINCVATAGSSDSTVYPRTRRGPQEAATDQSTRIMIVTPIPERQSV